MADTLDDWTRADALSPGPRVSALAIAALVLSVLWVFGLGSLAGICTGCVALYAINRSWGELQGRTVAALAVGLGVLGLAATLGGLAWLETHPFTFNLDFGKALQPSDLALGQTGTYSGPAAGAPRSVTAYFVSTPSPHPAAPSAGTQYAVVEVEVCAGARPFTPGRTQSDWSVQTSVDSASPGLLGGTAPDIGATSPGLSVAAHACGRGSIVFTVPSGSAVTSVDFIDLPDAALPFYRWNVP